MSLVDRIAAHVDRPRRMLASHYLLITSLLLTIGAFLAPGAAFIIDGGIYTDMARSMAENAALHIGANGGVDGAPALTKALTHARNGLVYPQYPSGYALLAAPFYKAFGVHGLMLMNALSFAACMFLTFRLAERFYNARVAAYAAAIFALATFAPTYAFAIWPHMIALLFWLAGFYLAVAAADAPNRKSCYLRLLFAGLAIGAGINIRIDVFLAAIAIFIWLRAFARPDDRLAPLALIVGAVPGLLLAAWLNDLKFGAFTPFSYNSSGGAADIHRYSSILLAVGIASAALWTFNANKHFLRAYSAIGALPLAALLVVAIGGAMLISPIRDLVLRLIDGVYVLVINLQAHDAYYQEGVERNQYGHLLFWNYPKKALIQSLPFLPLIFPPVFQALRSKTISGPTLALLAITAPIAFYSLNQWHGGGSYSMRYFIPALPFIAILSAATVNELVEKSGSAPSRQAFLIILCLAAASYVGLQEIAQASERWLTPLSLYLQWLIAGVLTAAIILHLRMPNATKLARATLMLALFAIAYAGAINIYEEITHEKTREEQLALSRDASAPIRPGALVFSQLPLVLKPAEANGASIMTGTENNIADAAQAANAFARAGRCIYFHTPDQAQLIGPHLEAAILKTPIWAPSKRFEHDPRLAFFVLEDQQAQCAF